MFTYRSSLPRDVKVDRPIAKDYLLLDEVMNGTRDELYWSIRLLFDSYHINNHKVKNKFSQIAAREFTNMEALAQMMQLARGLDASYVDCIDLNNPSFEKIPAYLDKSLGEEKSSTRSYLNIPNDLCGMLMENMNHDRDRKNEYEAIKERIEDNAMKEFIDWLIAGKEENLKEWDVLLNETTYPIKHKNFGLGYLSENDGEDDAGNYFDKPNPYFINPSDMKDVES